ETPKTAQIRFEWQPVEDAVGYTLRISPTTMFTKMVKEVKVSGTSAEVSGLEAGDYFWNVTASQGKTQEMLLDIESTQIHGRVAELIGKTEPGAALIINGQAVANISPDGTF